MESDLVFKPKSDKSRIKRTITDKITTILEPCKPNNIILYTQYLLLLPHIVLLSVEEV